MEYWPITLNATCVCVWITCPSNVSQSQYCQIVVTHVNSLRLSFFISKWDCIEMFTPLQNIWIILKHRYQKKKLHSYLLYVQLYIFPLVSKEQSWFTLSPVWLFQNLDKQQTGTLQLEHRIQLTSQKPICFSVCSTDFKHYVTQHT